MTGNWTLIEADVLDALRAMGDATFDVQFCDCPYGLGDREPTLDEIIAYLTQGAGLDTGGDFQGADWQIPAVAVWREVYRVLKPGGYCLTFGGTRTSDLITLGLRAAGFEIRDTIQWLHAAGMPKNADAERHVSCATCTLSGRHCMSSLPKGAKALPGDHLCPTTTDGAAFTGYGTGLKPSVEPIVVARKPLDGTIAQHVQKWGTGVLAIDSCRIGFTSLEDEHAAHGTGPKAHAGIYGDMGQADRPDYDAPARWPRNVVMSHSPTCRRLGTKRVRTNMATNGDGTAEQIFNYGNERGAAPRGYADADGMETVENWECAPECPARMMDAQSGERPGMSGGGVHRQDYAGGMFGGIDSAGTARGDTGGASRFFFCSKASRFERELGCEHLPYRTGAEAVGREDGSAGLGPRAGAGRSAARIRNYGPCLKPIDLTRYLASLVLPPKRSTPRWLLNLYAGTGSEGIGALRAGFEEVFCVQRAGDDDERGYIAICKARLERWSQVPADVEPAESREGQRAEAEAREAGQLSLLGGVR